MDYDTLASHESILKTTEALTGNGITPTIVENGKEALKKIIEMMPAGVSVMNGSSRTLEQIGFVEYLKSGKHGWNNLHEAIVAEKDPVKQGQLRKQSALSDFYLGSVHALSETGEFIVASNTGSQLSHVVFTSPNLIFVVGTQKIVPSLIDCMKRLETHVVPLEDVNMNQKYGVGTQISKVVIFKKENPMMGRKVHVLLVKEKLGF